MVTPFRVLVTLTLLASLLQAGLASAASPPRHVQADLISAVSAIAPGQTFEVALRERIDPGWHTYWKNPGDAGAPTSIEWHLPAGFSAAAIEWPWPKRIAYGQFMDYGYEGQVILPVRITAPANLSGKTAVLKAHVRWLVCSNICIPEQADLTLAVNVAATGTSNPATTNPATTNPATTELFRQAHQRIPAKLDVDATWQVSRDRLTLKIPMSGLSGAQVESADFYPGMPDVIDNAARQHYRVDRAGLTFTLPKGKQMPPNASLAGVVVVTEGVAQRVTSAFEVEPRRVAAQATASDFGLGTALLFAFLGGMILNLMPCVFPVLSIKVLALAAHRQAGDHARLNGWIYTAGVVLGFVAIAALLVTLRAAGEAVGWGFQLQSPVVVGGLAYLFFLIGLNLSGYFEAGAALMNIGDGLASRPGVTGSFFTGVLATIVAAPCTAPFMAGAVGYALLLDNNVTAFAVFASLGFGMAAPLLLLSYFPTSIRILPRPGPWMQTLREVLAFPMYGSAIWLVWVVSEQAGSFGVLLVLSGALLLTAAIWLWRRSNGRLFARAVSALLAVAALYAPFELNLYRAPAGDVATASPRPGYKGPVWQPYSASRLAEWREKGPVFIDFGAAWCITCKVNEAVALDSASVKQAFETKHVQFLKGDWTNQDPAITAALAEYGRSGVPLYLLYAPGQDRARVLPQILTESIVLHAVQSL